MRKKFKGTFPRQAVIFSETVSEKISENFFFINHIKMERQNVSNPKHETPFYSRWWGNITNYLEGWKNYFWDMFNPKKVTTLLKRHQVREMKQQESQKQQPH